MGILKTLFKSPVPVEEKGVSGGYTEKRAERIEIAFAELPKNVKEMKELPEATLADPFKTAALTVCAFCVYVSDAAKGVEMINYLKGPQELSIYDRQLIKDNLEGKSYLPFSYFKGAFPENEYQPSKPYIIEVQSNAYSYNEDGYAKMYVQSSGSDSLRSITLRKKAEQWFLWEQMILADIRKPLSADPWA